MKFLCPAASAAEAGVPDPQTSAASRRPVRLHMFQRERVGVDAPLAQLGLGEGLIVLGVVESLGELRRRQLDVVGLWREVCPEAHPPVVFNGVDRLLGEFVLGSVEVGAHLGAVVHGENGG